MRVIMIVTDEGLIDVAVAVNDDQAEMYGRMFRARAARLGRRYYGADAAEIVGALEYLDWEIDEQTEAERQGR